MIVEEIFQWVMPFVECIKVCLIFLDPKAWVGIMIDDPLRFKSAAKFLRHRLHDFIRRAMNGTLPPNDLQAMIVKVQKVSDTRLRVYYQDGAMLELKIIQAQFHPGETRAFLLQSEDLLDD
jgi:hypothetical protein